MCKGILKLEEQCFSFCGFAATNERRSVVVKRCHRSALLGVTNATEGHIGMDLCRCGRRAGLIGLAAILKLNDGLNRRQFVIDVVAAAAIGQSHDWFLRNPGPRSMAWLVCASPEER